MRLALLFPVLLLPMVVRADVAPLAEQLEAVKALAKRVLPTGADAALEFSLVPTVAGKEVFGVASGEGQATVALSGSGGVALASALNWYLKYTAGCSLTWAGDQLTRCSGRPLPPPTQTTRMVRPVEGRVVCTSAPPVAGRFETRLAHASLSAGCVERLRALPPLPRCISGLCATATTRTSAPRPTRWPSGTGRAGSAS